MMSAPTKKPAAAKPAATTSKPAAAAPATTTSSSSTRRPYVPHPKFPRNVKPDPAQKNADLEAVAAEVKKLRDERESLSKQMKQLRESGRGIGEEKQKLRGELAPIKDALQAARSDKDLVFNKVKQFNAQLDVLIQDERKLRENLGKFSSSEDIDQEIKRREKAMFEGRFSAREEKDMIRDMDKLRLSKKQIGGVQAKQDEIKQAREQRKLVEQELADKKRVVDEWQVKFTQARDALTLLDGKDKAGPASQLPVLREKHDAINEKLDQLDKKRQQVYDAWKQANADFVAAEEKRRKDEHQARADEQLARVEEQARYVREKEEARLAREAELEKQKPWEHEIDVCDGLVLALCRLAKLDVGSSSAQTAAAVPTGAAFAKKEPKKSSSSFGELKPLSKREAEDLTPATKKPAAAAPKPATTPDAAASATLPLILDVETLESFAFIGVEAPVLASQLVKSIEAVKEKRAYFDVLPRAAKKQTAAAAAKEDKQPAADEDKPAAVAAAPPPGFTAKKQQSGGVPSVKDATLFPTLPGFKQPISSAAEASTWGPKPSSSSPAVDDAAAAEIDYNEVDN